MKALFLAFLVFISFSIRLHAAEPGNRRRIVVIKADGVSGGLLDRFAAEHDPATGKSRLPWIDRVFYQNGARVANFYTRGISLSTPAWSLLDSGQHLQIHGNVEYDRYTLRAYDYLNFFPFYLQYARSRRVDMPAVEVLDECGIPLLSDAVPYSQRYGSMQLFQRGVHWTTLQEALQSRFTGRSIRQLVDEWQVGVELEAGLSEQVEQEIIEKLAEPGVRYLDIFTGDFDHIAHAVRDLDAQLRALQRLDGLVGRLWSAIQASPAGENTVLVLVSDHGMNTDPAVYSQGYNLVDWFRSAAGGGHHVITNRRPLSEYKLKGLDPFVSRVVTASDDTPFPKDRADQYPTVVLDLDGNERAAAQLRNSDLQEIHLLLREMGKPELSPALRAAAVAAVHHVIERNRAAWSASVTSLNEDLEALRVERKRLEELTALRSREWSEAERAEGKDKEFRRNIARLESYQLEEREYDDYARTIARLLAFQCEKCQPNTDGVERVIPTQSLGEANTLYQLQHYVVGLAPGGLGMALDEHGALDELRAFRRVDYTEALLHAAVRNPVQPKVGRNPVDFITLRLPDGTAGGQQAVWLTGGPEKQLLILSRRDKSGALSLRVQPVAQLCQHAEGKLEFECKSWNADFPLHLWEDTALAIPASDRAAWLDGWHTEREWFQAVHRTRYSNAVIGLQEFFERDKPQTPGSPALAQLQERRRRLTDPDFLILARDHWNFNVRAFNPGGNHGSFFRPSTHATLLFAGGRDTPVRHVTIEQPYDSLSFTPTVRRLMDLPVAGYPGPLISEVAP